jgi:hypothetical protein
MNDERTEQVIGNIIISHPCVIARPSESPLERFTIRVEPGAYPVILGRRGHGPYYAGVRFSGVIVDAGWNGKQYAEKLGRTGEVFVQKYKYELRGATLPVNASAVRTGSGECQHAPITLTCPDALDRVSGV